MFADLNLGLSDDDELEGNDQREGPEVVREGVAQFASLLMLSATQPITPASSAGAQGEEPQSAQKKGRTGKRGGGKGRGKRKPSKWADKCMYAELLEMQDDQPWGTGYGTEGQPNDGLPDDLETGWVALAPVPVGKRCLAVTQQSAGMAGVGALCLFRIRRRGAYRFVRSTQYDAALPCPGESDHLALPLSDSPVHNLGLHFGPELASERYSACAGRYTLEGPRCRRLRGGIQVNHMSVYICPL